MQCLRDLSGGSNRWKNVLLKKMGGKRNVRNLHGDERKISIFPSRTWLREENKTFVSYVAVFDENEEWIFIPLCK